MEGSEDEANQVSENGATAATRSELDMWEAARASDSATYLNNAQAQEVHESELTGDAVRMYLREISRVALLTAADEVVLARAIELAQRLEAIEKEIQGEIEVETPDPITIITDVLSKLGPVGDTASAVAKYLGLETPATLMAALTNPDLRALSAITADDISHCGRLADDEASVPGLTIDQEMRWEIAARFVAYGLDGAQQRVDAERERAPAARGPPAAARRATPVPAPAGHAGGARRRSRPRSTRCASLGVSTTARVTTTSSSSPTATRTVRARVATRSASELRRSLPSRRLPRPILRSTCM